MILVDASIWIDHLRIGNPRLEHLLAAEQILAHPFVIGELALGYLPERQSFLAAVHNLPSALMATDAEVLRFIEDHDLVACGVGYVDAHLLAATRLTVGASLWTRDKRAALVAERLNLAVPDS